MISAASSTISPTSLKPLCPTHWTARTSTIKFLLDNFEAAMTPWMKLSEWGKTQKHTKKAPGLQALMTQFTVFFGLSVSLKLFSSAEEVARVLQSTDVSAETVESAVQMLQTHYRDMRSTDAFHCPECSH